MFLAGIKDAALPAHTSIFVKPIKNQTAWRPVLGILQLLRVRRRRTGLPQAPCPSLHCPAAAWHAA